jgi:hypothetical protein
MNNQFGKNYEYIDDYIDSSTQQGRTLLAEILKEIKKTLINKDETIKSLNRRNNQQLKHIKKQLEWLEEKDKHIKLLKNKLKEYGVKKKF